MRGGHSGAHPAGRPKIRLIAITVATALTAALAHAGPTNEKRFEECKAKLQAAKKLDLLYDLAFEKGRGYRVLVGPTYYRVPLDAKEGFVATLNCFLNAGETKSCMNFDLRDWKSGKVVGRYRNCRLQPE